MCTITKDGYLMKDGTVIAFKKLNFGDMAPHHVEEMNETPATMWNIVLMQNSLFEMKDEISKMLLEHTLSNKRMINDQTEAIQKMMVNKNEVRKIINEEIESRTDLRIKKSTRIFEFMWKSAVVVIVLINLYLFIVGKSPIQITP